jgi:predicted GH43/DUF377 family glycosyl hydrolase
MASPGRRRSAGHPVEIHRSPVRIDPNLERVVARPFIPSPARIERLAEYVSALSDDLVLATETEVLASFGKRHASLESVLDEHATMAAAVVPSIGALGERRRRLLGAYLTQEYSMEAAAITNPSIVPAPTPASSPDQLRFVLSMRAIGEGHISSIRFREGLFDSSGRVELEPEQPYSWLGRRDEAKLDHSWFAMELNEAAADSSAVKALTRILPDRVGTTEVEDGLAALAAAETPGMDDTAQVARWLAASNYHLTFDDVPLDGRVVMPAGSADVRGVEDARFIRFTGDGPPVYHATYTGYDGHHILPQLLTTPDFRTFDFQTTAGKFAHNKGMALFPRLVQGSYAALTRHDQTSLHLSWSDDIRRWSNAERVARPERWWEMTQIGNCGSPIETDEGWLVMLHGVGPMRRYVLSAMLLDLDDPSEVIGRLVVPLLDPEESERDGYVPNVVYSCGALTFAGKLLIPYGMADRSIGFAVADLDDLFAALV